MELNLTTWQRVILVTILNQIEGTLGTLRKAGHVLDILELTEDEKKAVKFKEDLGGRFSWEDTEKVWHLEFSEEQGNFLRDTVRNHNRWPVSHMDKVMDLAEQVGITEG